MAPTPFRMAAAGAVLALVAGCATVPMGPAVPAMPGSRVTPDQFVRDDVTCRQRARIAVDPSAARANDAAAANVVGSTLLGATVGTLIGAAAGDAGAGAAIGAGMGLLGGSAAASTTSGWSSAQLQGLYDRVYFDCMFAYGHRVPAPFVAHRAPTRGYAAPPGAVPAPAGTPPPRGYAPPTTLPPAGGFPPPNAPPPAR